MSAESDDAASKLSKDALRKELMVAEERQVEFADSWMIQVSDPLQPN